MFETARLRSLVQRTIRQSAEQLGIDNRRMHNFRAHYTTQFYQRLRTDGLSDRRARRQVAAALGHGRIRVLRHYLNWDQAMPE